MDNVAGCGGSLREIGQSSQNNNKEMENHVHVKLKKLLALKTEKNKTEGHVFEN